MGRLEHGASEKRNETVKVFVAIIYYSQIVLTVSEYSIMLVNHILSFTDLFCTKLKCIQNYSHGT